MSFSNPPSRRLYVGRVSARANRIDLEDFLATNGIKPVDVKLLNGYGFVEYDSVADAEDSMKDFDGKDFMGDRLLVQFAKGDRRRDDRDGPREPRGADRPRGAGNQGWRITISNLPSGTSWQDLKDFGRTAGSIHYAEVSRNDPTEGVIEYMSFSDADNALKTLDNVDMRGNLVRLREHTAPPGESWSNPRASPPRRESRYDDRDDRRRDRSPRRDDRDFRKDTRDRFDGRRDDRDRDDRRAPRRERTRSRSPPRRERSPRYD